MKKIYLTAIAGIFLFSACSENPSEVLGDGEGSIVLSTTKNIETDKREIATRAEALTDFTGYSLTLNDDEMEVPANGRIDRLVPDTYLVGISNMPSDGDYTPAFDDPRYSGYAEAIVVAGESVRAEIELTQANAGVYFVYDPSLEDLGLMDMTPVVTSGGKTLDYSGNRDGRGYFMPGDLVVNLTLNGQPIDIDGEASRTLRVKAAQLWKVTLKGNLSDVVSLRMEIDMVNR